MHKAIRAGLLALVLSAGEAAAQFCPGLPPWVFDDVPITHPFCTDITWMAQRGVTLGCAQIDPNHRLYCPDDSVPRSQMAAFMRRLGDALFPLTCAPGQLMKWDGLAWACANDSIGSGGGTVTSVAAGSGLTAAPNPITGAGAMAVDTMTIQSRVSGSCAVGSSIRAIAQNGTVTCEVDDVGTGTVTSIATGAGMTGGPITTTGTINLTPSQLLPTVACGTNLIPKWNGSAWACAADANSGGTVTSVATGTGLTGGPITGVGTISMADGGVGTTQLADGSVNVAKLNTASTDARYFKQGGNSLGAEGVIGTADNNALDIRANGLRVMRYEPNAISPNIVGGSPANNVTTGVRGATIAGGGVFIGDTDPNFTLEAPNRVTDAYGTVGGGYGNRAGNDAGTGVDHPFATVGGGYSNVAERGYSTIAGGSGNMVNGVHGAIGGGQNNTAGASSSVGGGIGNSASSSSAVGGGTNNSAVGVRSFVGGGESNDATGDASAIAGGIQNAASANYSSVSGGTNNRSEAFASAIVGGANNVAQGSYATVAGGRFNLAQGDYSWVAGQNARAMLGHSGAFVWADTSNAIFASTAANEFSARATGGVRIVTAINVAGTPTAGVSMAPGDSAWGVLSDRAAKENWVDANGREVLERLVAMPIGWWNYKAQSPAIKHIGPTAQDFHAAFGLGRGDTTIATVDADGIALAAIQGLNVKLAEQTALIRAQQREIDDLRRRIDETSALLAEFRILRTALKGPGGDSLTRH